MTLSVSFLCTRCGDAAARPDIYGDEIAGFERSIEWLSAAPISNGADVPLLARAPAVGERHWVSVRFPFTGDSASPFWSLYRPPAAHFDGWDEVPEDIPGSAVVECRLDAISEAGPERATIRVAVLRTIPVPAIGGAFPAADVSRRLLETYDSRLTCVSRWERFTHFSYSLEGDVGSWALVERRGGADFLILRGDWSWHRDWFTASNWRLGTADAAVLTRPSDH